MEIDGQSINTTIIILIISEAIISSDCHRFIYMYIGEFNMDKITLSANKINMLCIAIWYMYNTRIDGKPLMKADHNAFSWALHIRLPRDVG